MAKVRAAATLVLACTASLVWPVAAHAQEGVSPWELLTKRGSFIVGIGLPQVILGLLITITAAALIYNAIRSLEGRKEEQEWVKQPELDEEEGEEAKAVEDAAAAAAAAAAAIAAAQAVQATRAPEPTPAAEPIFAPLKPAFTAPPPEVSGQTKAAEPEPVDAPGAPSAPAVEPPPVAPTPAPGMPQEQYLAPAEKPVEQPTQPPAPETPAPEPEVPEPPAGQAWADQPPEGP
jgi:hypothetical protein